MCSDEAADSHRFKDILDAAIQAKEVSRAAAACEALRRRRR